MKIEHGKIEKKNESSMFLSVSKSDFTPSFGYCLSGFHRFSATIEETSSASGEVSPLLQEVSSAIAQGCSTIRETSSQAEESSSITGQLSLTAGETSVMSKEVSFVDEKHFAAAKKVFLMVKEGLVSLNCRHCESNLLITAPCTSANSAVFCLSFFHQ